MNRKTLNTLVAPFIAAGAVCFSMGAMAADTAATATTTPALTKEEAKNLKTQSDAEYKARQRVADANRDLNKAECETQLEGGVERACKKSAKMEAKQDKADAKVIHEAEKAEIKAKKTN